MTRRGLRSESQSEKEDIEFPPAQTSPTLSGEESSMEDQPSLKQIMDLCFLKITMVIILDQLDPYLN